MGKNILIEREDGKLISANLTQPGTGESKNESPLLIMAPGFPKQQGEGMNFFSLLVEIIKKLGLSSLQFDYAGSVNAGPEEDKFTLESAAIDFKNILEWAEENEYQKVAFVAEGLGAPLIFMNLPKNALFSILCWPAFDFKYVHDTQFKAEAHKETLEKNGFFNLDNTMIGADLMDELQNTDLLPYLQEAHTPTLVLHGMEDDVIPIEHLDIAREDLMVPRLVITSFDGGKHGLTLENQRKTSIHHITEFIEKYWDFDPLEE